MHARYDEIPGPRGRGVELDAPGSAAEGDGVGEERAERGARVEEGEGLVVPAKIRSERGGRVSEAEEGGGDMGRERGGRTIRRR